jgi:transcriptional regulator with XRE-family HTH domain
MMSCSETVKRIRMALNLNQKNFADKLNLSKTSIYNYEEGRRKPKRSVVFKIRDLAKLNGIDVTLDELM